MNFNFVVDDGPVDTSKVLAYGILLDLYSGRLAPPLERLRMVRTSDPSTYVENRIIFGTGGVLDPDTLSFDPQGGTDERRGPLGEFWKAIGPEYVSSALEGDDEHLHPAIVSLIGETLIAEIEHHAADPDGAPHGHVVRHVADTVFHDDPYEDRFMRHLQSTGETLVYILKTRIRSVHRRMAKTEGQEA